MVALEFKPLGSQPPGYQTHTSNLDPIAVYPKAAEEPGRGGGGPGPDPTSPLGRKTRQLLRVGKLKPEKPQNREASRLPAGPRLTGTEGAG